MRQRLEVPGGVVGREEGLDMGVQALAGLVVERLDDGVRTVWFIRSA